jgi:hypothetical protein
MLQLLGGVCFRIQFALLWVVDLFTMGLANVGTAVAKPPQCAQAGRINVSLGCGAAVK